MTATRPAARKRWRIEPSEPEPGLEPHPRRDPGPASSTWRWMQPELSPRELAVRFTDTKSYFVSEASVYRLLKAHDLITSPAFIVIKAADEFKDKTTAPNQLWQTDFTYLKVIGWGWFYLSHRPRRLLALHHRLEAVHRHAASDVTDTLELALTASGCDSARVAAQTAAAQR